MSDDETRTAQIADESVHDNEVAAAEDEVLELDSEESNIDRNAVRRELARVKDFVQQLSLEDIRDGEWFARLLTFSLGKYVREVDAAYFRAKYPDLPPDAVVEARIRMAARYSSIEGSLSAAAYTGAVAATIGSGGGASPLTLPAGGASFVADLVFTTQIQLRLAYDISVLYGVQLDMDDPEDLWKLIRVAFVVKAGEAGRGAFAKGVPVFVRPVLKKIFRGGTLSAVKSLPVVGKYLLQRNIIKFGIPAVGVPVSAGVNYWSTKVAGAHARAVFREEARIAEAARRMTERTAHHTELLWTMWLVIVADGVIHESESLLLAHVTKMVGERGSALPALAELRATIDIDEEEVWSLLATAPHSLREIYDAGVVTAAIDGKIHGSELAILKKLAEHCSADFHEESIRAAARS
ncbi:hypothetical protein [Georgenia sp. H159]|uniref:hypothetical protein n=1 Tax=Georgenia sp. H159 TaxID=3076115 RepID=UPI002D78DDB7|nr:hypothetical protein [Georgenia sp. H159]